MIQKIAIMILFSIFFVPAWGKERYKGDRKCDKKIEEPDLKKKVSLFRKSMSEEELLSKIGNNYQCKITQRKPEKVTYEGRIYFSDRFYSYDWSYGETKDIIGPNGKVIGYQRLLKEHIYVVVYLWEGKVLFWKIFHAYYNQGPGRNNETPGELNNFSGFNKSDKYFPVCGAPDYLESYKDGFGGACKFNCRQFWDEGLDPCELETVRYYWETIEMGKLPEEYKKDIPKR